MPRRAYHHGNLREALVQAALVLIAERGLSGLTVAELARVVGVSSAAPYRHFRDRDAVLAELGRRGFEALRAALQDAACAAGPARGAALEACAQAHLAFAAREAPLYAAMFDRTLQPGVHPHLAAAQDAAFAILRAAAQSACDAATSPHRPPASMVALHVWAMTHGIADLLVGRAGPPLPMPPAELLEAALLIYLQTLGPTAPGPIRKGDSKQPVQTSFT